MEQEQLRKIISFLSEIQVLKRVRREGVRLIGVENPDSVAEHALLAAQIAYVLAKLEGADAAHCVLINLFHDNEEARTGDLHNISASYSDKKQVERLAESDHYGNLPSNIADEILEMQEELRERKTKEAIIAKDADWLEAAIQAKIYMEIGYAGGEKWLDNVGAALETISAKEILAEIRKNPDFLNCWWRNVPSMTFKKS